MFVPEGLATAVRGTDSISLETEHALPCLWAHGQHRPASSSTQGGWAPTAHLLWGPGLHPCALARFGRDDRSSLALSQLLKVKGCCPPLCPCTPSRFPLLPQGASAPGHLLNISYPFGPHPPRLEPRTSQWAGWHELRGMDPTRVSTQSSSDLSTAEKNANPTLQTSLHRPSGHREEGGRVRSLTEQGARRQCGREEVEKRGYRAGTAPTSPVTS